MSLTRRPIEINIKGWYPIVVVVAVMVLITAGNIWWTYQVDHKRAEAEERARRESDARWCNLMVTLDDAYSSVTPATEVGRKVAKSIKDLRTDLRC